MAVDIWQEATIFHFAASVAGILKLCAQIIVQTIIFAYLINSSFNDKQKKYKSKGYADTLFYRVDEQ